MKWMPQHIGSAVCAAQISGYLSGSSKRSSKRSYGINGANAHKFDAGSG